MKVEGRRKYMRRAVFAACLLDVFDFNLVIVEDPEGSYMTQDDVRSYTIAVEPGLPKCVLMEHLAHEIVHLAQYVRGDMVEVDEGVMWKGELYPDPEYLSDDYFLSPWEMEARALQAWIVHKWETRSELH